MDATHTQRGRVVTFMIKKKKKKKKRVNTQGINIQNVTGKWQQKNGFPSGATRRNKKKWRINE
jgi:hypothetical protein